MIMLIMTLMMGTVVTYAATTFSNSKVYNSTKYKYAVGVLLEYTSQVGLDKGYFRLSMAGEDKDATYVPYEAYRRYGTSSDWSYKSYFEGKIGCYTNKAGDTVIRYSATGTKNFTDSESFRVKIWLDGVEKYTAATNEDY